MVETTPLPTALPAVTIPPENVTEVPQLPQVSAGETLEENVVYALPSPEPEPMVQISVQENQYAIDLEAYYSEYADIYISTGEAYMQYPALTREEKERLGAAKARYDAGERPQTSILNRVEDVSISLCQLPPEQYQGEQAFLVLPYRTLTDDELLQIIDAYAAIGMEFQPESLSWRNCMRGGGIECSRSYAGDELERANLLTNMYLWGNAAPEGAFTPQPMDDGVGMILLNEEEFCGMEEYRFFPARRMSDEELLEYIAFDIGEVSVSGDDYSRWENQTRQQLHNLLGMPLTVESRGGYVGKESDWTVFGGDRQAYRTSFYPVGESNWELWNAELSSDGETLISANAVIRGPVAYSDLHCDPFDGKWSELAAEWVQGVRSDSAAPVEVECWGEGSLGLRQFGAVVCLTMDDGSTYTLYMDYVTERPFLVVYMDSERSRANDEYWADDAMEEIRRWREE